MYQLIPSDSLYPSPITWPRLPASARNTARNESRRQPTGDPLTVALETLDFLAHHPVTYPPVEIFRIDHDDENPSQPVLRTLDLAHRVPGMRGSLKNKAAVAQAVGSNLVLKIIQ